MELVLEVPERLRSELDSMKAVREYADSLAAAIRERFDMLHLSPQVMSGIWTGSFLGSARSLANGNDHPEHRGSREVHECWRFSCDREVWALAFFADQRLKIESLSFEVSDDLDIAHNRISRYAFRNVRILKAG